MPGIIVCVRLLSCFACALVVWDRLLERRDWLTAGTFFVLAALVYPWMGRC